MVLLLSNFSDTASYIIYILLAILVLLVMITVHEFGHFITGKILGFKIEEFSIGFGPKLFQKEKANGELFSLRLIPLGGYCAFGGEDEDSKEPDAFNNKKPWQRILVLLSGVLMNYITALLIICLMYGVYGYTAIASYNVIENNEYGSEYSLKKRDVILEVEGEKIYLITDLMQSIDGKKKGDIVNVNLIRDGKKQDVQIKLLSDTDFSNIEEIEKLSKALGMDYTLDADGKIQDSGFRSVGVKLGFFDTIGKSFVYSGKLASTVFTVFRQLFTGSLGISSLGGTVTTISVTAETIRVNGFWGLLNISAFIGVNLAVFNLIPFPALDGSRTVFTIIEWIAKKPVNRKVEATIHTIGFVILLLFTVFVDLQRCF